MEILAYIILTAFFALFIYTLGQPDFMNEDPRFKACFMRGLGKIFVFLIFNFRCFSDISMLGLVRGDNMNQPIIVCAACKLGDVIIAGARHFDSIMQSQMDASDPALKWGTAEQGFIDQFGKFYDREAAMQIVKESGQPFDIDRNIALFSEGLY